MKDKTILLIVAIICITVLELANMYLNHIDGSILSIIVASIVFVATGKFFNWGQGGRG